MRRIREFNPVLVFGSLAVTALAIVAGALPQVGAEAPASFYIIHLSPDAPPLDVYVDGAPVAPALTYGESTTLTSLNRFGMARVEARLAGTSPDSQPVITADVNLNPGTPYVIAVANALMNLQIGAYSIPLGGIPEGLSRVQVIHAAPGAPRIGVRANQDVISPALGYLEDPPYLDVTSGTTRVLGFTAETPTTLLLDETVELQPGAVHTVILAPGRAVLITTVLNAQ